MPASPPPPAQPPGPSPSPPPASWPPDPPQDSGSSPPLIALFGTSADPPTQGHRALLQGLLQLYPQVVTWASDNPLKQHTAPLALRQALLGAMVQAIGDSRLSLVQELSSPWTMETLARARERWPGMQPLFVIGGDLVAQVPRWRGAQAWLPGCRLAIAPRLGFPMPEEAVESLRQLGAIVDLLPLQIPASASSGLRARLAADELPAELLPLLRRHDPYGLLTPRCASPSPSSTS